MCNHSSVSPHRTAAPVSLLLVALSCAEPDPLPECGLDAGLVFADDFEDAASIDALTQGDRFANFFTQNGGSGELAADPEDPANTVLRTFGPAGDRQLVKANIQHKGLCFDDGDLVSLRARHFIPSGFSLAEVFLIDLECEACGDENPGVRLQLKEQEGRPRVDRGKLNLDNVGLGEAGLPRDRWFELRFDVRVGDEDTGSLAVFVDGEAVIEVDGETSTGHRRFDNAQFALTASASPDPTEVLVDDAEIHLLEDG